MPVCNPPPLACDTACDLLLTNNSKLKEVTSTINAACNHDACLAQRLAPFLALMKQTLCLVPCPVQRPMWQNKTKQNTGGNLQETATKKLRLSAPPIHKEGNCAIPRAWEQVPPQLSLETKPQAQLMFSGAVMQRSQRSHCRAPDLRKLR